MQRRTPLFATICTVSALCLTLVAWLSPAGPKGCTKL